MKLRADRLDCVQPSIILSLAQKAGALAAEGHPAIDLGIGESDFTTPHHIKEAAIATPAPALPRPVIN